MSRDGFIIKNMDGKEIDFIPCDTDHESVRDRTLSGLLRNMGDDYFVCDTRWEHENSPTIAS